MTLVTDPNLTDYDAVYERLIEAHAGRSAGESEQLNARLIMLLINHVGDEAVIFEAISLAARHGQVSSPDPKA